MLESQNQMPRHAIELGERLEQEWYLFPAHNQPARGSSSNGNLGGRTHEHFGPRSWQSS